MNGKLISWGGPVIAILILGMFGCKSDSATPNATNPPANTVAMSSSLFNPAAITVARGTTITWRNDDGVVHTSTSDSTGWDTGNIQPGASATTVFSAPGTFTYHCTFHVAMGMVGTITVQ